MTVWTALIWLAMVTTGAFVTGEVRKWLGTEVKHKDTARGIIYYIAVYTIVILSWEASHILAALG